MSRIAAPARARDNIDWPLLIVVALIAVVGVVNLYSATSVARAGIADLYVKQIYWLVAGGIEAGLSQQDRQLLMAGMQSDWANESFQVAAHEIYARIPAYGPVKLPRDYADRERAVVRQQLLRAGLRLAAILNAIYR